MYLIDIGSSIVRILKTPKGQRVMRPDFGSDLYLLRDRKFNDEFKLLATRYIYESIKAYEPRVKVEKVDFIVEPVSGTVSFKIALSLREKLDTVIEDEKVYIPVEKQMYLAVIGVDGNPVITTEGEFLIVKVTND